ncbi:MAG: hypothetical protein ABR606_07810 [Vicinamibacterales bacterium]
MHAHAVALAPFFGRPAAAQRVVAAAAFVLAFTFFSYFLTGS